MTKGLLLALSLFLLSPLAATAEDSLAKFDGGIGVIPVSNVAGAQNANGTFPDVTRNVVRGVNPAGQIWVIADLQADVNTNGRIQVEGRGLLLGGGNAIGTNANQSVRATLLCANDGNALHDTGLVPLEANGDFRIDDMLSGTLPSTCTSAVLLIRNPNGAWFAAGIPKLD